MKKLLTIITLGAMAFALPVSGLAAKKDKATPTPAPAPDGAKKPAEQPAATPAASPAGEEKHIPFNVVVDTIDAKSFTHKKKDGQVVTFMVTDKTEVMNAGTAAKLSEIKVGDTVSGSRIKKSATEYEVVKITKFGIAPPKEKKGAMPATATPAPK